LELFPNVKDIIDGTIKKYLLRIKSKETGKYLSSQKASFLLFGIIGAVILITGIIKLIPFYGRLPFNILKLATTIHDIAAWALVILLAVHVLLAVVWGAYRPLLLSWFNGRDPSGDPTAMSNAAIPETKNKNTGK
jgi:cytochrome b subunit of formate dehydrogenase